MTSEATINVIIEQSPIAVDIIQENIVSLEIPESSPPSESGEIFENLEASTELTAGDTNTVFTNENSSSLVEVDLPPGAPELKFTFLVTDPNGFSLIADGADTIRIGGSAAGTMTCTQAGGAVVLYGYSGGYIAASSMETWIDS